MVGSTTQPFQDWSKNIKGFNKFDVETFSMINTQFLWAHLKTPKQCCIVWLLQQKNLFKFNKTTFFSNILYLSLHTCLQSLSQDCCKGHILLSVTFNLPPHTIYEILHSYCNCYFNLYPSFKTTNHKSPTFDLD